MRSNVERDVCVEHGLPVCLQIVPVILAIFGGATAGQRIVRSRHDELIALFCRFHNGIKFVNSRVLGDFLVEENVIGIERKEIERTKFKIGGEFSVQVVKLEAGLEKLVIVWSVVLMIAGDHNDGNSCCSFAEHDEEALVVEAVIGVKIISYIAIDHNAVNLLLVEH